MRLALVLALGTAVTIFALPLTCAAAAKPAPPAADPTIPPPGWKAPKNAWGAAGPLRLLDQRHHDAADAATRG